MSEMNTNLAPRIPNVAMRDAILIATFILKGSGYKTTKTGGISDEIQTGGNLCIGGGSGVGKTMQFGQIASIWEDFAFHPFQPGIEGDAFMGGIPVPIQTEEGEVVIHLPPIDILHGVFKSGQGYFLCDDMTNAKERIFTAMLALLCDGRLGSNTLDVGIRIFGAFNPRSMCPDARAMVEAILKRIGILYVGDPVPSILRKHNAGALLRERLGKGAARIEKRSLKEDEARIRKLFYGYAEEENQYIFGGYLEENPSAVSKSMPESEDENPSPSPRGWTLAMRARAAVRAMEESGLLKELNADRSEFQGFDNGVAKYRIAGKSGFIDESVNWLDTLTAAYVGSTYAEGLASYISTIGVLPPTLEWLDGLDERGSFKWQTPAGTQEFQHTGHQMDRTMMMVQRGLAKIEDASMDIALRKKRADAFLTFLTEVACGAAPMPHLAYEPVILLGKMKLISMQRSVGGGKMIADERIRKLQSATGVSIEAAK